MGMYGGLRGDDVKHWGERTTFKSNASELLAKALKPDQIVYCSPLVDPFQPAEANSHGMLDILEAVSLRPPRTFVVQTRSSRILALTLGMVTHASVVDMALEQVFRGYVSRTP